MANHKTFVDRSDWGCDLRGRDLRRRGLLGGGASRRGFMKQGALALIGTSVIPSFPMG